MEFKEFEKKRVLDDIKTRSTGWTKDGASEQLDGLNSSLEALDMSIHFESKVYDMIKKDNSKVAEGEYKFESSDEYNAIRKDLDLYIQNNEIIKLEKQRLSTITQIEFIKDKWGL